MDTSAQYWQQETGFVMMKGSNMGEIMASSNACTKPAAAAATAAAAAALDQQKRARPQEQLNCPRCNSTNTKFCYYNNYSLTQPRYFCKTCRRYWTEGGTLRNVPVGGGSRKNRKPSTTSTCGNNSSIISKSTNMLIPDLNPPTNLFPGQDLNLAFPAMQQANNKFHYNFPTAKSENDNNMNLNHPRFFTSSSSLSFVTASGGAGDQAVIPPGSNTATFSSSGFQFPEFKPASALGFCSSGDGLGSSRFNNFRAQENGNGNGNGRILFPFGEIKRVSRPDHDNKNNEVDQHKGQQGNNPTGYWSGLLGGGGSW